MLQVAHMVSPLNRRHCEASPQIELAADDVRVRVGRVCQAFVLTAFFLVPPPITKWLGYIFSFSRVCFIAIFVLDLDLYLITVSVLRMEGFEVDGRLIDWSLAAFINFVVVPRQYTRLAAVQHYVIFLIH